MDEAVKYYEKDEVNFVPDDLKAYLDEHYLKKLKNLSATNPKLLVIFAGANAAGKSTISEKISKELHGLVLRNDIVREMVIKQYPGLERVDRNHYIWGYHMSVYERLDQITKNGLVVRDAVSSWYPERILPVFTERGYAVFIIAFDVSREKYIEIMRKRGDTPVITVERQIEMLDEHLEHLQKFLSLYTPDITLHDDNMFDHDTVIAAIKARLDSLR